jgi:hypothetical protein
MMMGSTGSSSLGCTLSGPYHTTGSSSEWHGGRRCLGNHKPSFVHWLLHSVFMKHWPGFLNTSRSGCYNA